MTDDQRQRLSALVDGEGSDPDWQRAISDAIDDPALGGCFERYLIIRRAIRGEPLSVPVRQVAARVAASIALASADVAGASPGRGETRAGQPPVLRPAMRAATHPRARRRSGGPRPLIGLALAAGVVLLAVVVGPRHLFDHGPAAPQFAANPDPAMQTDRWRVADDRASAVRLIGGADLDRLLVSHRERSAASGLAGFMPYATLVGYDGAR